MLCNKMINCSRLQRLCENAKNIIIPAKAGIYTC